MNALPRQRTGCGSAYTISTLPARPGLTSGVIAPGGVLIETRVDARLAPVPNVIATYWRRRAVYVAGWPIAIVDPRLCQSSLPVFVSNALMYRSKSPMKTRPPAVVIADVVKDVRCR